MEEYPLNGSSKYSAKRMTVIAAVEGVLLAICTVIIAVLLGVLIFRDCDDSSASPTPSPTPTPSVSNTASVQEFYFFQISDIHTNINYTSETDPVAEFGEDGGMELLNITLDNMKNLPGEPAFILISGDFPTHNLPSIEDQINTITAVSYAIKNVFPNTKVYPALGNNDVYPDYYFPLNTNTQWMTDMANLWGTELQWLSEEQLGTFNPNGFYIINELWDDGPALIVLNTLLYSSRLNIGTDPPSLPTPVDQLPDDPNGQFAWLTNQLESLQAQGKRAILQYHIPSGVNSYDDSVTWHEKFTNQFSQICSAYSDTIIIQLAGHYHTDEFRLMNNTCGILLNPSISPDHTNNPSFRKYIVNQDTGELSNYFQYYMDLVAGNAQTRKGQNVSFEIEYDFTGSYGVSPIDGQGIYQLWDLLDSSLNHYMMFLTHQYVGYPYKRGVNLCSSKYQQSSAYVDCIALYDDDEN